MFVFCLSLLANGKWRAFLSQIIQVQHVPCALSLCCWAAGVNHGNSWHACLARVQVCHRHCDFHALLFKTEHNRRPQKPVVTQESEIPTLLNMTESLQDSKMTTPDDKKSLIWLSKQVHPKQFEMHRVADTLTQSTDRIPQGPTAGTQVKYVPGHLKWLYLPHLGNWPEPQMTLLCLAFFIHVTTHT